MDNLETLNVEMLSDREKIASSIKHLVGNIVTIYFKSGTNCTGKIEKVDCNDCVHLSMFSKSHKSLIVTDVTSIDFFIVTNYNNYFRKSEESIEPEEPEDSEEPEGSEDYIDPEENKEDSEILFSSGQVVEPTLTEETRREIREIQDPKLRSQRLVELRKTYAEAVRKRTQQKLRSFKLDNSIKDREYKSIDFSKLKIIDKPSK